MKKTIYLGGAHRGGKAITEKAIKLLPEAKTYDKVLIADPKEDRAWQLAREWKKAGVNSQGLKEPCEEVVENNSTDAIVLAIDTVSPMSMILGKNSVPTQWQLLARGLGVDGPVIGLCGTVVTGASENRSSSIKLIDVMSSFIQPQSSSNIRQNPLNADILHTMRNKVSEHSVKRLEALDREPQDISGGALNLLWGMKTYPMMIHEKPINQRWKETKQQVMETELSLNVKDNREFAVATVGDKNVDFFVVESLRGRRIVKFHLPLVHALPSHANTDKVSRGNINVTDLGLGLLAVASALASVVVTD